MNRSAVSCVRPPRLAATVGVVALLVSLAIPAQADNVSLLSFGSSGLVVDAPATSASYTQGASALTFTEFDTFDATTSLVGSLLPGPQDWSTYTEAPYTDFGLTIGVGGSNPNAAFSLSLLDGTSGVIATYGGATTGLTSPTPVLVTLSRDFVGTGDYSSVARIDFSWNDSMSPPNTVTVGSLVAITPVPEPYGFATALAGLACVGHAIRRRRPHA